MKTGFISKTFLKDTFGFSTRETIIFILILMAIGTAVTVVVLNDPMAKKGSGLGSDFKYDLSKLRVIDPALIHYKETARIKTGFTKTKAIATGPDDRIYVAGDETVQTYDASGSPISSFKTPKEMTCLAVSTNNTIYTGITDHVEVYDPNGKLASSWKKPGGRPHLTSIALGEDIVFAADSGNRQVICYDNSGKIIRILGKQDKDKDIPRLIVPSNYLDVSFAKDGLLRLVNPGNFQVELFTPEGDLELKWGKHSDVRIENFCGCCNPSHIATLPDGRIVTSEKGLYRIKVYDSRGTFQSVVAGFAQLGRQKVPLDIATDSRGRILALDSAKSIVRIFTRIKDNQEAQ